MIEQNIEMISSEPQEKNQKILGNHPLFLDLRTDSLIGWLIDWQKGWVPNWLNHCLSQRFNDWLTTFMDGS